MNRSTYLIVPLLALASMVLSLVISSDTPPSVQLAKDMAAAKTLKTLLWCEKHSSRGCQGLKTTTS